MFTTDIVKPTQGKMAIRKQVRFHSVDAKRIQAAAAACGLHEAEFIRQAALLHAQQIERRMSLSILPIDAFEAFGQQQRLPAKRFLVWRMWLNTQKIECGVLLSRPNDNAIIAKYQLFIFSLSKALAELTLAALREASCKISALRLYSSEGITAI